MNLKYGYKCVIVVLRLGIFFFFNLGGYAFVGSMFPYDFSLGQGVDFGFVSSVLRGSRDVKV